MNIIFQLYHRSGINPQVNGTFALLRTVAKYSLDLAADNLPIFARRGHGENGGVRDEPIPPIEYAPPYSMDFVAHLDAGYPNDVTRDLLAAVRTDPAGSRLLNALSVT